MKKKIFALIAAIACAFSCASMLSACDLFVETDIKDIVGGGENQPKPPHEHEFIDGKCECGADDPNYEPPHEHEFVDGKCECGADDSDYQPPHEHEFVDGKCECGADDPNYQAPHEHVFVDGKCECGADDSDYQPPHEHEFVDGKCECGADDPNYEPPHEHVFVDGKCECGADDPDYETPHEHRYADQSDENGHWTECVCGDKTEVVPHSYSYEKEGDYHWQICSVKDETTQKVFHTFNNGVCVCGETKPDNELEYALIADGTEYKVTGIGTVTSKNVEIPETYHGLPVTEIGVGAFKGNGMTSVSISTNLVKAGASAFKDCNFLTRVDYAGTISEWAAIEFGWYKGNPLGYAHSLYIDGVHVVDPVIGGIEAIGSGAFEGADIQSVKILDGVKILGGHVFRDCINLVSAEIPNSVTEMGEFTFWCCEKLSGVTLSENLEEIKDSSFLRCTALKTVKIPAKVNKIGDRAFSYSGLTSVNVPAQVKFIGYDAFAYCGYTENGATNPPLQSVTFEDTGYSWAIQANYTLVGLPISIVPITTYFDEVISGELLSNSSSMAKLLAYPAVAHRQGIMNFYGATTCSDGMGNVYSVYVKGFNENDDLFDVEVSGFEGENAGQRYECKGIPQILMQRTDSYTASGIHLSENENGGFTVNSLADGSLTELNIPATVNGKPVTEIAANAFKGNAKITSVNLPSTVSVGESAFENCVNLKTLTVTDVPSASAVRGGAKTVITETVIGDSAFKKCGLTEITLSDSVKTMIGRYAFAHNYELVKANLGNGLYNIGDDAFSCCSKLATVNFGNNLREIGSRTFFICESLKQVDFPETLEKFGNATFKGCDIRNLHLPKNLSSMINNCFNENYNLQTITVDPANQTYAAEGNCLIYKQAKFIIQGSVNSVIPNDANIVTSIDQCAFYGTNYKGTLSLPENINKIGECAFENCTLSAVKLSSNLETISGYAFKDCINLTSVEIPDVCKDIGPGAFWGCSSLTSVIIGSGVERFCSDSFAGCVKLNSATFKDPANWTGSGTIVLPSDEVSSAITVDPTNLESYFSDPVKAAAGLKNPFATESILTFCNVTAFDVVSGCCTVLLPNGQEVQTGFMIDWRKEA